MVLVGCGTSSKKPPQPIKVVTVTEKAQVRCPAPPELSKVEWREIIWVVATQGDGVKVLGISEAYYINLAKNTQASLRAIKDRNALMQYYQKCIDDHNSAAL